MLLRLWRLFVLFFVKNGRIGESCVGVQPYSSSILKCQFDALSGRYVQFVFDILLCKISECWFTPA